MNKNKNIVQMPVNEAPANVEVQLPELFTEDEVTNYLGGEVISTTDSGCIFVMAQDRVYLFQPVARTHCNSHRSYYNRLEFK